MAGDTRLRLLLVAERLFAQHGIEGVPLRRIGTAAGQRFKSAPQYYFEDRDGLVTAILEFRQEPLNARRHQMLGAARKRGRLGDLRSMVEILVLPLAELVGTEAQAYLGFLAALEQYKGGQLALDPTRAHTDATVAVSDLIGQMLSSLTEAERHLRMTLLRVLVIQGLATLPRIMTEDVLPPGQRASLVTAALVDGASAVLAAPSQSFADIGLGTAPGGSS